jgi:hypothetical protein
MSNNRSHLDLCAFTFADGRRCQMPESVDDSGLCYFHSQKFRDRITRQEAGKQISQYLNTDILTACDLSSAFATLFCATAKGFIKPKTAATLTYLGQLMLQTQRLAKEEFLETFESDWPKIVEESSSFAPDPAPSESPTTTDVILTPDSPPAPQDAPQDDPESPATEPAPVVADL